MRQLRPGLSAITLGLVCFIGAGCGVSRDVGLAGRCADIMQRAFPSADIQIGKSEASATGLTTIVARVEGVRGDMPPDGPLAHELAVKCQFDNNILTGFRWTAGPLH
jgi:hypothetical protein